jgi:transcriptional regulator with XRE-family HTH domain
MKSVNRVERGKRNVTVVVLARIAKALKTTPDRLLVPGRKSKG